MTMEQLLAVAVDLGPAGAALLIALDNRRRLTALAERLRAADEG